MSVDTGVNWLGAMQLNKQSQDSIGDMHKYISDLKAKNIDNKIQEYAAIEAKNKNEALERIRQGTSSIMSDLENLSPSQREQSTPESRYADTMNRLNKVMMENPVYGGEIVKPIAEALGKVKEADQEAVMKQMNDRFTAEIKGRLAKGEQLNSEMIQQAGILAQIFDSKELAQISTTMTQGDRGMIDAMRILNYTPEQQQKVYALSKIAKGAKDSSKTSSGSAAKLFSAAQEINQAKDMILSYIGEDFTFGTNEDGSSQLAQAAQAFHDKAMELWSTQNPDGTQRYTRPGDAMYDAWVYMTQVSGEIYAEGLGPGPATREQWDSLWTMGVKRKLVFDPEKAMAARKQRQAAGEALPEVTPGGVAKGMQEEQQAAAQTPAAPQRPPMDMAEVDRNLAGSVPNIPVSPLPYDHGTPMAQNNVSEQMAAWENDPGTAQIQAAQPPAPPTRMRPLSPYELGHEDLMYKIKNLGSPSTDATDLASQWAQAQIAKVDPLRQQDTPQELFPIDQMDENSSVLNLVQEFEGFRSKAYKDSTGKWTIGYGTTRGVQPGDRISKYEAVQRAKQDLQGIEKKLDKNFPGLTVNQKAAVASLVYNIGWERFRISKAFRNLKDNNIQGFLVEAFDPDKGFTKARNERTGKLEALNGLLKRRALEMKVFLS